MSKFDPNPKPVEGDVPAIADNPQPVEGDMSAIVEDTTVQPQERQYRVVGEQAVFGWNKGETFTATFTPEQEEYYLDGGHLEVVTAENAQQPTEVKASVEVKPDVSAASDPNKTQE